MSLTARDSSNRAGARLGGGDAASPQFHVYAAGEFTLNFGWTLGLFYYMGLAANHDARGRIFPLVPAAVVVATARVNRGAVDVRSYVVSST